LAPTKIIGKDKRKAEKFALDLLKMVGLSDKTNVLTKAHILKGLGFPDPFSLLGRKGTFFCFLLYFSSDIFPAA